jgi:hypothetical protein
MKAVIYAICIVFAAILAPIAALLIAIFTFFTCFVAFMQGVHKGMMQYLYNKIEEELAQPEDIWEKHINRMKVNKNKHEK